MLNIVQSAMARAAIVTAATVVFFSGVNAAFLDTGWSNLVEFLLGAIFAVLSLGLCFVLATIVVRAARRFQSQTLAVFIAVVGATYLVFENSPASYLRGLLDRNNELLLNAPEAYSLASALLFLFCLVAITNVFHLWREERLPALQHYALLIVGAPFVWLCFSIAGSVLGSGHDPFPFDGAPPAARETATQLKNPADAGAFEVQRVSYGAGVNKRRPEFGRERDFESRVVDARPLLPQWKGFKQSMRENYWGFGLDAAPLNALVWAPKGEGPFPLVLIVHGNHGMEDYSDAGYAYLAELLASRGFIVASVDQNYINGSWSGDFRGAEMALRGWLLLEHLALWRNWNNQPDHPLGRRADMEQIALIGHSRGGEAVSIAAAFNQLPRFPDNGAVAFDYGFNLRSLVAIAQVDQRYHRRVKLADINFFTIHGSYDSDEPAYHGLRQMHRIDLSPDSHGEFVKAGVYLHGANHGQFNKGWGRHDYGWPGASRLNTAPIITEQAQREAARVYISAFLEATLHGDGAYRQLLRDPRVGRDWLPAHSFVAQYQDSSYVPLADFEEDLNLATATYKGATLHAEGLSGWVERPLLHRDKRLQGSQALYVDWDAAGAELSLTLPSPLDLQGKSVTLAVSAKPADLNKRDVVPSIASFSLVLEDASQQRVRIDAEEVAQLVPPVRVQYLKSAAANKQSYNALWEPVLQHLAFPVAAFATKNPAFDPSEIVSLELQFDGAEKGSLILDHWGFADTASLRGDLGQ